MNPQVWYKSPQYVGMGVAAVAAFAVLAPHAAVAFGLVDPVVVYAKVEAFLTLIGLCITVGTLLYAMVARKNSTVQPLTFTRASATAQITPTSQIMQDLHDAVNKGGVVTSAIVTNPAAVAAIIPVILTPPEAVQDTSDVELK